MDDREVALALERSLSVHFGATVAVRSVERLVGGASRSIYGFDADVAGRPEALALVARFSAAPGRIRGSGVDEFQILAAAHEAGVAVPRVYCRGRIGGEDGEEFFVMDRVRGEAIARRLLRDQRYARARGALPDQLARSLARVHAICTDDSRLASLRTDGAGRAGADAAANEIARYRQLLEVAATGHPYPVLAYASRWLQRNTLREGREAVVHGDFRIGNVMFDEQGLTAVLDWELAHLGDPLEDIGWLAVHAWRFGSDEHAVGGLCSRERFWAAYEREGGTPVDPAAARYWEIFGNWKWAIICVMQSASHRATGTPDVELAAIGRRVADTEWEILALIEEADRAG